jgi:hypothetical protein
MYKDEKYFLCHFFPINLFSFFFVVAVSPVRLHFYANNDDKIPEAVPRILHKTRVKEEHNSCLLSLELTADIAKIAGSYPLS